MHPNPPNTRTVIALAILAVATAIPSGAATVRRLELQEVRSRAASVFTGEVVGVGTRLGNNGQMVWTDYEVEVGETFAGRDPGQRTTLSFAGGTLPELSIGIPGVPELREGLHYLFFIEPRLDSPEALMPMPTVGWGQGLFRIVRVDDAAGSRTVLISADGEPLEISADGRLTRGARVTVVDGRVVEPESAIRDGVGIRVRPSFFESPDGTVRPIAPSPVPEQAAVRTARTFATLDDLRLFAQGRMGAVSVKNR